MTTAPDSRSQPPAQMPAQPPAQPPISSARLASGRTRSPRLDVGLLAIRIGIGLSFVLLLALKPADATKFLAKATGTIAAGHLGPPSILSIAAFFIMFGLFTRAVAALSASACLYAAVAALHSGLPWFVLPVLSGESVFLFTALAITGPGKFSLDHLRRSRQQ
jgi:uncharacterized membrane protein YphA (DoxX/SURF4 family)